MKKQGVKTEGERIAELEEKIKLQLELNTELTKEFRSLKQQQKSNANELVVMNKEDNYPVKIRQILEEIRVSRELNSMLKSKLSIVQKQAQQID